MDHKNFRNQDSHPMGGVSLPGKIFLVVFVMGVLGLMIIPLPSPLLDLLLIVNIVMVLLILVVTLTITDALRLSTFPSLLLVCALFRLGLNISSTRLILSRGEAGLIIETFGHFVTDGNLIVGMVVFLILLIIQYLVVAKGSERVAEVAARFTLDALPGKQMSIDADLRASAINADDAALKRGGLIKESRFYGAMDGAMKFVKGDVLAGFVITAINMIGGLMTGIFQRGWDLQKATEVFTVLTIGDGLVSQVPALILSVAAGFLVTRVTGLDSRDDLGSEIVGQVFYQRTAIFIVSFLILMMSLIPGFPRLLVVVVAVGLFGFALWLTFQAAGVKEGSRINRHLCSAVGEDLSGQVRPLVLELGQGVHGEFLISPEVNIFFDEMYPRLKSHLTQKTGVMMPEMTLRQNTSLSPWQYRIALYGIPAGQGELRREKNFLSSAEVLLRHLAQVMQRRAVDFIGIQEVSEMVSMISQSHDELVKEVVPRRLTLHKLTEVMKRLVEEGIPVTDLRLILETLSTSNPDTKSVIDLCEFVRIGLSRVISHHHAQARNSLACFVLDPEFEREVSTHIQRTAEECYLSLPPQRLKNFCDAVEQIYKTHGVGFHQAVILTAVEIRRTVRKMIETQLPDVAVLSYQELDPYLRIEKRDTICVDAPVLSGPTESLKWDAEQRLVAAVPV